MDFSFILADYNLPFSVALCVMFLLGIVELLMLLVGGSLTTSLNLDHDVDVSVDLDHIGLGDIDGGVSHDLVIHDASPDFVGTFLDWLYVGRMPILIILVSFLSVFGLIGYGIQSLAIGFLGNPFSLLIASALTTVFTLPTVHMVNRGLYKVLPKDETTAVPINSLIGYEATIVSGIARQGYPAEAKVVDKFGQTHYILVEPIADGDSKLIEDKSHGNMMNEMEHLVQYTKDERVVLRAVHDEKSFVFYVEKLT